MILNLVKIKNIKTNTVSYHAVNELHYNSMLACGGTSYELEFEWEYMGDVEISEEILNEEGVFYKDNDNA
jgi:hypothetical protein